MYSVSRAYQHKQASPHIERKTRKSHSFACLTNYIKECLVHDHIAQHQVVHDQRTSCHVVDLGCGRGADFIRFDRAMPIVRYTGIDMSRNMLSQGPFRGHSRVQLICQSIETANLPDADFVWTFMGMQNVCGTEAKLLSFLARVWSSLKDGGVFLGAFPNGSKILHDIDRLNDSKQPFSFSRIPADAEGETWYSFTLQDAYEDLSEVAISPDNVLRLAEQIGFKVQATSFAQYTKDSGKTPYKRKLYSKIIGRNGLPAWAMQLANYYTCFVFQK